MVKNNGAFFESQFDKNKNKKKIRSTNNDEFKWRSNINFVFRFASEQSCTYRVKIKTEYNTDPYDSYLAVTTGFHSWLKKPADTITINLANSYKVPYLTEKTALLMHEMGHVIGLNHTGEGVGNKIPGTSDDTDYLDSLFRAGGIEDSYPGTNEMNPNFTDYDIKAIMFLYGYKYLYGLVKYIRLLILKESLKFNI